MKRILEQFGFIEENVSLKNHNTYRINTTAKYMLHPRNKEELKGFIKYAKENTLPFFLLGNGSNVILDDKPYEGVVLKLDQINQIVYEGNIVSVGAGVMINRLSFDILDHNLKGLEWASGIPGTVGGAIYGNAEAYKVCTFEYLKDVTYLDQNGEFITKEKKDLAYGYRESYFKSHPELIIVSSTFCFPFGNKEESFSLIKDRMERRISTQPLNYPSAGSVFRNPDNNLPAGKLIDDLGLKGYRINDAMISDRHANFIINVGEATGKDIKDLIKLIKIKVEEEYGIILHLEQEIKSW